MNRSNKAETIDAQGPDLSAKQDTPDAVEVAGSAMPNHLVFSEVSDPNDFTASGKVFRPVVQVAYPPFITELEEVFGPLHGKQILYAVGEIIYNPMAVPITRQLFIHECTHGIRQGAQVLEWWTKYMADRKFRFDEELVAHREEYKTFCALYKDRNLRDAYRRKVAQRLAGPLYGSLITYSEALKVIR